MLDEKDRVAGRRPFYMTPFSEKPHSVTIVGESCIWWPHLIIRFSNDREMDVSPRYLYHSWKEALKDNPPERHIPWESYRGYSLRRRLLF